MAVGSVQYVITCVSSGSGTSTAPCGKVAGVGYKPLMVPAYVVDPASQSYLEAVVAPFDYELATKYFGFGFSGVAGVFLASYCIGLVVGMVRRHD